MSTLISVRSAIWMIVAFSLIDKYRTDSALRHGTRRHHHHMSSADLDKTKEDGLTSISQVHTHQNKESAAELNHQHQFEFPKTDYVGETSDAQYAQGDDTKFHEELHQLLLRQNGKLKHANKEFHHRQKNLETRIAELWEDNLRLRNENKELISEDREVIEEDQSVLKENRKLHNEIEQLLRNEDENRLKQYDELQREYGRLLKHNIELRKQNRLLPDEDDGHYKEIDGFRDDEGDFLREQNLLYLESLELHKNYTRLLERYAVLRKQITEIHRCCLEPTSQHDIRSVKNSQNEFVSGENNTICEGCIQLLRRSGLWLTLHENNDNLQETKGDIYDQHHAQGLTRLGNNDPPGVSHGNVEIYHAEEDLGDVRSKQDKHGLGKLISFHIQEEGVLEKPREEIIELSRDSNGSFFLKLPVNESNLDESVDKSEKSIKSENSKWVTSETIADEKFRQRTTQDDDEYQNLVGNFSWETEDRSKAFDHVVRVTDLTSCDKPIPQVFAVQDLVSDKKRYYSPQATVLHRCGPHSGCCANEFLSCVPAKKEKVELFFFMVRIERNETFGPIVEMLHLTNHTKCGCVYKQQEKDYLEE